MLLGDVLVGATGRADNGFALQLEHVRTGDAGSRQHDDKRDVRRAHGRRRADNSTLAVADDADVLGIDFFAALQIIDASDDVAGHVVQGLAGGVAGGTAHAAVIQPQNGDAAPRQIIGDHQKRLVTQQRLIAILRSGTGYHDRRWKWSRPAGQCQRTGQLDAALSLIGHILGVIWIRRLGVLRAIQALQLFYALENQRKRDSLHECPGDFLATVAQFAVIAGM